MSDFFKSEKRRKRALTALSALLAASLSLGVFAACGASEQTDSDEEDTPAVPTDTQILKNGNFEFYGNEMVQDFEDKRTLISSPTSWSFQQGSPTSDTRSGIVVKDEWKELTTSGYKFTSVKDAYENFEKEEVTVYDRLKFYDEFKDEIDDLSAKSAEKKLFDKYSYSIDYEDVENLAAEVGSELKLHPEASDDDKGVLMIHNQRTSENVLGTAQSYQMSSTYTLGAGTAAKLSLWVRTEALFHYGDSAEEGKDIPVTYNAGAYISLTATVGTNSSEVQIKNIVTGEADEENNGWRKYEILVRGNTYATSTFRVKLGLGQGSSDNRIEMVNGYAFFDDLECTILKSAEYDTEKESVSGTVKEVLALDDHLPEDLLFDATKDPYDLYAVDMLENGTEDELTLSEADSGNAKVTVGLTADEDGWTSERKGFAADNREPAGEDTNIGKLTTLGEIKSQTANKYLTNIYKDHFADKSPLGEWADGDQVVMLLSANGAAYTAKLEGGSSDSFTLQPDEYLLFTFFVKTSEMRSGRSGAGAKIADADDPDSSALISSFDSTAIATVDIDEDRKDIYNGWVPCTFFIANETEEARSFTIELTYGPISTAIASSTASSYGEGWAAFTGFRTRTLDKSEYGYVTTGDRAKSFSLSEETAGSVKFDDAGIVRDIEKELAHPVNFSLITADSRAIDPEGQDVTGAALEAKKIYSGLLSSEYAKAYSASEDNWKTAFDTLTSASGENEAWWQAAFKDGNYVARQPLVLLNDSGADTASVGYYRTSETLSANSTRRISVRMKVSAGQKAYLYLIDTSDVKKGYNGRLTPSVPASTYWYDDDGNLCGSDPSAEDYDETNAETGILYELQTNGLYLKKGSTDGKYYANLANYEVNDKGNLATSKGEEVFYGKKNGDAVEYYAYYDDSKEGDAKYSTRVYDFPAETPKRYTAPADLSAYETVIEVDGDKASGWVTVSFFLRTGNTDKEYRVEVWAGARDDKTAGFKANGYVFFDDYRSADASSTFGGDGNGYLDEAKELLEAADDNVVDSTAEEKRLKAEHALYYTFTFYDSADYVRYDGTVDETNRWASYKQSGQEEKIVYLACEDLEGNLPNGVPSVSKFIDYSAAEQTVTPDETDDDSTSSDNTADESTAGEFDWANLLLIISSVVLALVLLAVIGILAGRKIAESLRKSGKLKPKAKKPAKKAKPEKKTDDEKPAPAKDENDPYNE